MNIRRGLFRAWIVLSVVWAIGFGSLFWQMIYEGDFYTTCRRPIAGVSSVDPPNRRGVLSFVQDVRSERIRAACASVELPPRAISRDGSGRLDLDFTGDQVIVHVNNPPAFAHFSGVAIVAVGPPLAVLGLGFVVGWVARGFRA